MFQDVRKILRVFLKSCIPLNNKLHVKKQSGIVFLESMQMIYYESAKLNESVKSTARARAPQQSYHLQNCLALFVRVNSELRLV